MPKLKLDPHQEETVRYMLKNRFVICALDMGLGKSPTAITAARRRGGPCLIVCPSYLLLHWEHEISKWAPGAVFQTIRKGKDIGKKIHKSVNFVLISYNLAQKAEHFFEWARIVVLDEVQELKSMKAKRTEFIHRVVYENSIPDLYMLTGTPIKNRVEEYYSLLALCNYDPRLEEGVKVKAKDTFEEFAKAYMPKIAQKDFLTRFPDSIKFADHFSHRRQFTMQVKNRWITVVKWEGHRNIDELKLYLKGRYIRFASKDILQISEPRTVEILISDTNDKALLSEFTNYYSKDGTDSVKSDHKAEAALKKVPFTVRYVKDLLENGVDCVPIYTDHVESAKALAAAFDVPAITGAMPSKQRAQLGKDFQSGHGKVLVATIRSFSTGIDLTRANNLVFNDLAWVPGDNKQTIYRIQRRNQTRQCVIHTVLGSPQDAQISRSLAEKMKTIEAVV
jgi:superfamily II DNA or RNA helicase